MKNQSVRFGIFLLIIFLGYFVLNNVGYIPSPVQNEQNLQPQGMILTPLNNLLMTTHQLTSNYGMAIILMTILLRFILSPLQYISQKSIKKIQIIQPQLNLIKEKFKNDPEEIQKETLNLFKINSVNPVMGFLPTLLQMPLFFAFYKLLRVSPQIVGANFIGWLTDLSLPDHLYILPILAGLIQLGVLYFNARESSDQKMIGKFQLMMSLMFTGIMLKMPVALLLYTITSSVSSLIEKGIISRMIS